jgi:membrane-associated phospholipid phosphatase
VAVEGSSLRTDNGVRMWLGKLGDNPLVREGTPLLGLYWLYSLTRWWVAYDNSYAAFANAVKIIQLEKRLGIFYEPIVQSGVITHALGMVRCANWFYVVGYFPVLILTAVLLYRFDRQRFHTFKLMFILGLGLALVCYSLFPLAPPRMLPHMGLVDTQQVYGSDLYNNESFVKLYNPYAAMPSLHFGWALLVGIMAFTCSRWVIKAIGFLYPLCMALVIVMTGHHYFLDIAGGGVVVGLAYGLVNLLSRTRRSTLPVGVGVQFPHRLGESNTWLLRLRGAHKVGRPWPAQRGRDKLHLRGQVFKHSSRRLGEKDVIGPTTF